MATVMTGTASKLDHQNDNAAAVCGNDDGDDDNSDGDGDSDDDDDKWNDEKVICY